MPLKYFSSGFWFFFLFASGAGLGAEDLRVYFKSTPRVELLRPLHDPADLSLLVTGVDGRPVEQGSVHVRLNAPKPGVIFSTDFPLVEGTLLSEMRLPLRQGKANWKILLPIRGEYRLSVDATASDGRKTATTFNFTVRENESKWLALAGFSFALFLLGFGAGRIFTGSAGAVVLLIMTAWLSVPSASARARDDSLLNETILEIEPATVGRASKVRWARGENDARAPALLSVSIEHLEKEKIAFAIDRVPVAGEFSLRFHFTDGARYRVRTLAQIPGEASRRNEQVVDVNGVEPPARAIAPALSLFVGLIALGLGVGRWSKRRKRSA